MERSMSQSTAASKDQSMDNLREYRTPNKEPSNVEGRKKWTTDHTDKARMKEREVGREERRQKTEEKNKEQSNVEGKTDRQGQAGGAWHAY
jgi:hypothetical protein